MPEPPQTQRAPQQPGMRQPGWSAPLLWLRWGVLCGLALALLAAMVATRNWPLVGDAALMHYVVFLLRAGAVPYRDVVDINLPGTYLFEHLAMALFGGGAWGLRLYDWSLLLGIGIGCVLLVGRRRRFAGLLASLLFALAHLQDGVQQQGQRDLLLAALLVAALPLAGAFAYRSTRYPHAAALGLGVLFGTSLTIKPVLLPLLLLLLVWIMYRRHVRTPTVLLCVGAGLLLPPALGAVWLQRRGGLHAIFVLSHTLFPLHASLGHRSLGFLLTHSVSPMGILVLLCLPLAWHAFDRSAKAWGAALLLAALLAYAVQGKGFPYQRYPFLILLLLGISLAIERGLRARRPALRALAAVAACWALGQGVHSAVRSAGYQRATPTITALTAALQSLGPPEQLSGSVQCLDTFSGCINTLYTLRIRQSTGYLYDCYLFTGPSPARDMYREQFWRAYQKARPRVVVVTGQNCFQPGEGYARLNTWPRLASDLQLHYKVAQQWSPTAPVRWFSRPELPFGFRVLVRRTP